MKEIEVSKKEVIQQEIKEEDKKVKNSKSKKHSAAYYAVTFFVKIGITAVVILILLTFVVGIYVNHSNVSYPMIKDGDLCLTYRLAKYVEGDEIVYIADGKVRFGRIVAMPGDKVDINEEAVIVNGYGVYEDTVYPTTREGSSIDYPYTVPADTVFVLNDYRSDPSDSRIYGGIPLSETKGKVIMLLRRRGI